MVNPGCAEARVMALGQGQGQGSKSLQLQLDSPAGPLQFWHTWGAEPKPQSLWEINPVALLPWERQVFALTVCLCVCVGG